MVRILANTYSEDQKSLLIVGCGRVDALGPAKSTFCGRIIRLTREIVTILPEQVDLKLPLKLTYNKNQDTISENDPTPTLPQLGTKVKKKKEKRKGITKYEEGKMFNKTFFNLCE